MELTAALIEARTPARVLADQPPPLVPDEVLRHGADAILGSMGVASKPVEPGTIAGGIPAKPIGTKS